MNFKWGGMQTLLKHFFHVKGGGGVGVLWSFLLLFSKY